MYNLKVILLVFGCIHGFKLNLDKSTLLGININQTLALKVATFFRLQDV